MQAPTFSETSETARKKAGTSQTCQRWVFTLNNYTGKDERRLANAPEFVRWVGYGKEVAPTTGTPHLQGFLYCWQAVRMSQLKNRLFKKAHWEPMYGSFEDNEMYCNKEKDWKEYGERPQQGRRNDILGIKRRIDEGMTLSQIMQDEAFFALTMRSQRSLREYYEDTRRRRLETEGYKRPEVHIRVGPKESGKTRYVYERHGFANVFAVPDLTGKWHDGYAGQPVLLFDDVDCRKAPEIEYFKHIADGYPRHYPIKGGFTYIRPTHIYLTSNHLPATWYPDISPSDWNAIKRRINTVSLVYTQGEDKVVYDKDKDDAQEEGSHDGGSLGREAGEESDASD